MEGNEQVNATLGQLTDSILEMVDGTPATEAAYVTPPTPQETPPEKVAEPPKVEEPKPPQVPEPSKVKIKWGGQDVEMTQDELIKNAQMGYDYTQKTQELSKRASEVAPLEGLAKHIKDDPAFAAHIAGYFQKAQPQPPVEQPPDDPIEQLKWETRKEVLAEVEKKFQQVVQPLSHQQVIQQVKMQVMADPDYQEAHGEIVKYVQALPPAIQRTVALQLDQDPRAYQELFYSKKQEIQQRKQSTPPTETTPAAPEPPQKVTRTERAPVLEQSGSIPPETSANAEKAKKIAKLKQKAMANGDPAALAEWLLQSGSIDNIL